MQMTIDPMVGNVVVETFIHGGWVMWPILVAFFMALCVLLERSLWWFGFGRSVKKQTHEGIREALVDGKFEQIWKQTQQARDPFIVMLREGFSHCRTSPIVAMQLYATDLLEKAEARQWVLSTLITLAPLLGLLGTVVGIMGSFGNITGDLAVEKVSGGIGEALIATSCGLAIAIACLLPYNYFRKRASSLRGEFERWINQTELLLQTAKQHGHDLEEKAASFKQH